MQVVCVILAMLAIWALFYLHRHMKKPRKLEWVALGVVVAAFLLFYSGLLKPLWTSLPSISLAEEVMREHRAELELLRDSVKKAQIRSILIQPRHIWRNGLFIHRSTAGTWGSLHVPGNKQSLTEKEALAAIGLNQEDYQRVISLMTSTGVLKVSAGRPYLREGECSFLVRKLPGPIGRPGVWLISSQRDMVGTLDLGEGWFADWGDDPKKQ